MIKVSDTAKNQVLKLKADAEVEMDAFIRVGVKGGGCSGFSYILDLTESKKDGDEQWDFDYTLDDDAFKLSVICDPKSYLFL